MAFLNKVMIIGNVGKDPVIRKGNNRTTATFSVATSKRYRDANGEQKELTTRHNVVFFGKLAENIELLGVKKGASLFVEGELANRSFEDQNGNKRYVTEISGNSFQLLTPRNSAGSGNGDAQDVDFNG